MTRSIAAASVLFLSTAAFAGPTGLVVSPFPSWAAGPSGPGSAMFTLEHAVPDSVAVAIPVSTIEEGDFQWIKVPVSMPISDDAGKITGVTVCFETISNADTAWISQTRLTQQTVPGSATVVLDDGTDRRAVGGGCYTVPASVTPSGAISLALKVVMGDLSDRIEFSTAFLRISPR